MSRGGNSRLGKASRAFRGVGGMFQVGADDDRSERSLALSWTGGASGTGKEARRGPRPY